MYHAHLTVWCNGAPRPATHFDEKTSKNVVSNADELVAYAQAIGLCASDPMYGQPFAAPARSPASRTTDEIAQVGELLHLRQLIHAVQMHHQHSITCVGPGDNHAKPQHCRFNFPWPECARYHVAPRPHRPDMMHMYLPRRPHSDGYGLDESLINNYIPELLSVWGANLDVQLVCDADVTGVIMYMVRAGQKQS